MEDAYGTRLVYINLDNGMVSQLLRTKLMKRLGDEFGTQTYNESNVMLSGESRCRDQASGLDLHA